MWHRKLKMIGVVGGALVLVPTVAVADEQPSEPSKPTIYTGYGASVSVGGGVMGFADDEMRDVSSNVGGTWEARLVYGTRAPVAVEAAYTGGTVGLDALGLEDSAAMVSTGMEVLARVNLLQDAWQPYVMGGIGWRHFAIVNSDTNTSSITDDEDFGEVPLGGGLSYRYRGLVVDARALFRTAFNDELIATAEGEEKANLHSWQGQLTAGWEF